MTEHPVVAITSGEPAGIGPELCAMLAVRHRVQPYPARLVLLGDRELLAARARRIGMDVAYVDYDAADLRAPHGTTEVWQHALAAPVHPGHPDPTNAYSVLEMLRDAADGCATGAFSALVTAPVQKSTLLDAGIPFSGHTEFLAERTGTPRVVMLLVGGAAAHPLRVALVTTHLALKDVPAAITVAAVADSLAILERDLKVRFGLPAPTIGVCGLNPHAGEGGHLGHEEREAIAPAIEEARRKGMRVEGPLPADTIFVPDQAQRFDAILAMFHDQGLPVLKAASFGHGVNVTLGLPFVRTSVDHGTALDRAVDAQRAATSDLGSLHAALELAIELAARGDPVRLPL